MSGEDTVRRKASLARKPKWIVFMKVRTTAKRKPFLAGKFICLEKRNTWLAMTVHFRPVH